MSTFAVDGLVSGLDTTSLINQLMQIERLPQQRLQATLQQQNSSVSAYQSVATRLKAVEPFVTTLASDATWGARTASVTGSSVTATASPGAVAGQTTIAVTSLATAATFTATADAGLDAIVADPPVITIRNAAGVDTVVTAATGSMRDVMAAINDAPESGVTAIAVRVGPDAYRLQLRATETGVAASPQSVAGFTDPLIEAKGADAVYSVNGLQGRSASNTVTGLLPGLDVTFQQTGASTVTVGSDAATATGAAKALVDEVNKVLDELAKQTAAGSNGKGRGALASDSQVREVSTNLLRAVSDALGDGFSAQIGIETTKEGRLTFDAEAFTAAYERDPAGTRALLSPAPDADAPAGTLPPEGIAQRISGVIARATDPTNGFISNAVQGRERTVKDLQTQIDSWDLRLESRRSILSRQFSGLEVALQRIQTQGGYLASAISGMNAQTQS